MISSLIPSASKSSFINSINSLCGLGLTPIPISKLFPPYFLFTVLDNLLPKYCIPWTNIIIIITEATITSV